jgi:hypothetical protein
MNRGYSSHLSAYRWCLCWRGWHPEIAIASTGISGRIPIGSLREGLGVIWILLRRATYDANIRGTLGLVLLLLLLCVGAYGCGGAPTHAPVIASVRCDPPATPDEALLDGCEEYTAPGEGSAMVCIYSTADSGCPSGRSGIAVATRIDQCHWVVLGGGCLKGRGREV